MANDTTPHTEPTAITTGQAAERIGLSSQVIQRLFDGHEIEGYVIPGSGHRRINVVSLVSFCERHQIPYTEK